MQSYSQKSSEPVIPIIPIVQNKAFTKDENLKHFEEFKKLLQGSLCLKQKNQELKTKKNQLTDKLIQIEIKMEEINMTNKETQQHDSENMKPKRVRRKNSMIQKKYRCCFQKCDKVYASEGSLQQHIKLKHSEMAKVDKTDPSTFVGNGVSNESIVYSSQ